MLFCLSRETQPRPALTAGSDLLHDSIGAQAPNAGKPHAAGLRGLSWALVAFLQLLLCACHREPPEQALRNTITQMQAAAEAHDTDALFESIAVDFSGSDGMDRQAFRRYVTLMGLRNQKVGVQLGPLQLKLFGDRATVDFTAAISGGASWMPERAQVYAVETGWRLQDGEWKLISARWEPKL